MATLEELKNKYQSVIQVIQEENVRVFNMHLKDGKLFLKGMAPSLAAANKVWDELKRINPSLDDIIAEFPVDASKTPVAQTYTVKAGDTLTKISKRFYGNTNDYMRIFDANRDRLKDPEHINAGQEIIIPAA